MGSVTIGANTYDIYGTTADATEYLAAKIGQTEWTAASADLKSQALVSGTRLIRQYLAGLGQDLDPADPVDVAIEQANYELAYALVVEPALAAAANANGNFARVKAGSAEVEYFRPEKGGRFPTQVQVLLTNWLSASGASTFSALPYAAGTCNESAFSESDYGLREGY